jgi:hypothetical protein
VHLPHAIQQASILAYRILSILIADLRERKKKTYLLGEKLIFGDYFVV